ncbi:Glutaminyl-peptide cyclotransferase, partial [Leucoagaricus sp. SymC.cos]
DWEVEEDEFTSDTPVGMKKFTNIIATKDPSASRRLILSAHYDSKYFPNYPENQFVGATDSAAPCAIMLDIAETLDPLLNDRKRRWEDGLVDDDEEDIADMTLQLVFFDGEEAFHDWTDTDSIYGAKHLAEKWSTTYQQSFSKRRLISSQETEISSIEHLILLDLLGASNPLIKSYYPDTAWMFDALVDIEQRLGESDAFAYGEEKSMAAENWQSWFLHRKQYNFGFGYIGDDHVPFLRKGVSVLHIIADPFPRVWHTLKDDATALDLPTMRRWSLLFRVFLSEYLHLRPEVSGKREQLREAEEGSVGFFVHCSAINSQFLLELDSGIET